MTILEARNGSMMLIEKQQKYQLDDLVELIITNILQVMKYCFAIKDK